MEISHASDDALWSEVEPLLRPGREDLRRMRADPGAWTELAHAEGRDASRRAQVLWALQYDRQPADLELLRFLLEQETALCESDLGQGLGEQAALAAFLVCEHRSPDDVWRLWALKEANFDAACALDIEHLLTGGVQATVALVRAAASTERDDLLERLTEPVRTDAEIDSWLETRRDWYPADPGAESAETWTDRALLIGERETARRLLDRWTAGDPEQRSTRRWYLETVFGELAEATAIQRELTAEERDPWDRASAQITLAELERRAGRPYAAWMTLRHGGVLPQALHRWRRVNLARSYVEELFLLVPMLRGNLARQVFHFADRCARVVHGLTPMGSTAAVTAAEHVGDDRRRRRYERPRRAA
jgi:hypothetical protein